MTQILSSLLMTAVVVSAANSCPNVPTIDVDVSTYFSGRWFEISASQGFKTRFEKDQSCITADYYLNTCDTDHPVVVVNNGIKDADKSLNTAIGKARQTGAGKFEVSFFGPFYGPYWVIHTESSDQFPIATAVVYSCSSADESLWILSRTPDLSPTGSSFEQLLAIASGFGIDVAKLSMVITDQSDKCSYPTPESINQKPADDSGCSLSITGCSPAAWCSFQPSLTQVCRLKPTKCEKLDLASPQNNHDNTDRKDSQTLMILAVVGGVCVAAVVVGMVVIRRRRVQPKIDRSSLLATGDSIVV